MSLMSVLFHNYRKISAGIMYFFEAVEGKVEGNKLEKGGTILEMVE